MSDIGEHASRSVTQSVAVAIQIIKIMQLKRQKQLADELENIQKDLNSGQLVLAAQKETTKAQVEMTKQDKWWEGNPYSELVEKPNITPDDAKNVYALAKAQKDNPYLTGEEQAYYNNNSKNIFDKAKEKWNANLDELLLDSPNKFVVKDARNLNLAEQINLNDKANRYLKVIPKEEKTVDEGENMDSVFGLGKKKLKQSFAQDKQNKPILPNNPVKKKDKVIKR